MLRGQALYTVLFYEGPVLFLEPTNKKRDTEQVRHLAGMGPQEEEGKGTLQSLLEEASHRGPTPQPF